MDNNKVINVEQLANEIAENNKKNAGYKNKIYKAEANDLRATTLHTEINLKLKDFKALDKQPKYSWSDLEEVKDRTYKYLEACGIASTIPTLTGYCSLALGVSRRALNIYLQHNPDTPTAEFLLRVKDLFASILTDQSLKNNINPVMSIFILKSTLEHSDKTEIELTSGVNNMALGEVKTKAELNAALEGLDIIEEADNGGYMYSNIE